VPRLQHEKKHKRKKKQKKKTKKKKKCKDKVSICKLPPAEHTMNETLEEEELWGVEGKKTPEAQGGGEHGQDVPEWKVRHVLKKAPKQGRQKVGLTKHREEESQKDQVGGKGIA